MPSTTSDVLVLIPARMESKRFPGKPMAMAGGKPLVHWTYERACELDRTDVYVVTCDKVIHRYCELHDIPCMCEQKDYPSGTARCWGTYTHCYEPHKYHSTYQTIVNWQVDEPCLSVVHVNNVISKSQDTGKIATLLSRLTDYRDPNEVKAIYTRKRGCLWFTRTYMSYAYRHCGVYAFPFDVLRKLDHRPSQATKAEDLEQLSWIEQGFEIEGVVVDREMLSINMVEDWERFQAMVDNYETS